MGELFDLSLKNNSEEHVSEQDYKSKVVRAVEILLNLGIMDTKESDLKSSVKEVVQKLEKNDEILYGKKLNKRQVREELKHINSEIADLDVELLDIRKNIERKELSENVRNINLDG